MKNLLLTSIFGLFATLALATNNPASVIMNTNLVSVSTEETKIIFTSSNYDTQNENFEFTTDEDITNIQIYNASGEIEFNLPVNSNSVKINKNLFGLGEFKLGFRMKGHTDIYFSKVTIK